MRERERERVSHVVTEGPRNIEDVSLVLHLAGFIWAFGMDDAGMSLRGMTMSFLGILSLALEDSDSGSFVLYMRNPYVIQERDGSPNHSV